MDFGTIKKLSKAEQKFKIKIPPCINKKGKGNPRKIQKKKISDYFFHPHAHLSPLTD